MNVSPKEMLIIYNSGKLKDRKTLGYAQALKDVKVKTIDVQKDALTETQLRRIAMDLDVQPEKLIDKQSASFRKHMTGVNVSDSNISKILRKYPTMIHTPIVLYDKGGDFVDNSYYFVRKGMQFK